MKSLLYNGGRKEPKLEKSPHSKRFTRRISIETVFKQKYNDRILAKRNQLEQSNDPAKRLSAYNKAVALELKLLKDESPDEYSDLAALVEEMKESSAQDFDAQPEDVQEALVTLLFIVATS